MGEETTSWQRVSPWLFLVGMLVFLGSLLVFLFDLAMDNDVLRGIVANAVGGAFLIAWAALDTLSDPDSEVATRGGAAGTALLLYGVYLLLAGVVIVATGLLFHDRTPLGLWYLPLALLSVVVGFVIFPSGAIVEESDENETDGHDTEQEEDNDSSAAGGNEPSTDKGG